MFNSKYFKNSMLLATALVGLILCRLIINKNKVPAFFVSKQQSSLNINYNLWKYVHLGQKRMISSLYWISTILESDVEHYKGKDLNSWMFLRFNTISMLDPLFLINYDFGGTYLSILKDDIAGATIIFDKGLGYYPNDYSLLKKASFHYYFEANDFEKAYKSFLKLKKHPKINNHLLLTLSRLASERGNLQDAYNIILNIYQDLNNTKNSALKEKAKSYLYAIKSEIDLNCLNNSLEKCDKIDFEGNFYHKIDGKYKAAKEWTPYRIKIKKFN